MACLTSQTASQCLTVKDQFVQLAQSGIGYYHFPGTDDPYEDNWGMPYTRSAITTVAYNWYQEGQILGGDDYPRIGVGDIGRKDCAYFGHSTHYTGEDADFRYVRSDFTEGPVTINDSIYSQSFSLKLLQKFDENANVEMILTSDQYILDRISKGCLASGHEDHFHVRFKQ